MRVGGQERVVHEPMKHVHSDRSSELSARDFGQRGKPKPQRLDVAHPVLYAGVAFHCSATVAYRALASYVADGRRESPALRVGAIRRGCVEHRRAADPPVPVLDRAVAMMNSAPVLGAALRW